jgi:Acetyltransferase (GNAT) family
MSDLRIRSMRPDEISIAVDWAAAEGWNPGLADAACFSTVDPDGFLVGELDGAPAATICCVNYGATFAFLGLYIVRKDVRGCGHGLKIWNAALAHAGPRVIGLDGVVAQQQNYKKSGFKFAYANVRYGGTVVTADAQRGRVVALAEVPSRWWRLTMQPYFRLRALHSCVPGLAHPDMSGAHSYVMADLPLGA